MNSSNGPKSSPILNAQGVKLKASWTLEAQQDLAAMHAIQGPEYYEPLIRAMHHPDFDFHNPPEPFTQEDVKYVFSQAMEGQPIGDEDWNDLTKQMVKEMQEEIDAEIIKDLVIAAALNQSQ